MPETTETKPLPQEMDPSRLIPMQREWNRGLMVRFINNALLQRAHLDVRKSFVFYDADRDFMFALEKMPNDGVLELFYSREGVRYWSKGC